ncbi:MAG: uncharacterized protein JWN86_4749 [Planctomycetota bacterium]|nr:uncharacterized protein [Planctomycetota bacterium]
MDWKHFGPYVSERAWGTVREDYSADGDAWSFFPHAQARSRAYRWNEDGLAGFCNRFQNVCLGLALWNEHDPILKERLFGLNGHEGNHGEDVKEYYRYLDATPTHSYMKMLYKYPQVEFPYAKLLQENARRSRADREYELFDAIGGAFRAGKYFDVYVEYAKSGPEDILCRITAVNRGNEAAPIHVLPHLWFRNTWSWGHDARRPEARAMGKNSVRVTHRHLGERWWYADGHPDEWLFTENETNNERLFGSPNEVPHVKDAFHDAVIQRRMERVNPDRTGTKAAAHFRSRVEPGGSFVVRTRFSNVPLSQPFSDFDAVFDLRCLEADQFHEALQGPIFSEDERRIQRQALAGLLWSKQFYHYSAELWLAGDPAFPPPPPDRGTRRNGNWGHFYALDVLSVPDKWEYPWFAAWDTAFHCIPLALIDPEWAKRQLILPLREWYMHPNGQLAAYEWDFSDVNPPVHALAARRVYELTRDANGTGDVDFLEEVFHKLLLNFTWWVNRKDLDGRNAFQGGFLGLDNIGVFDRSKPEGLPEGSRLEQADGTAWMGLYCLEMLAIALELSKTRPAYEATATKFFEHFVAIAHALNGIGGQVGMWNAEDRFYYDVIRNHDGTPEHVRVRTFVGLIPLFAVLTLAPDVPTRLPQFWRRVQWYLKYRPVLAGNATLLTEPGPNGMRMLSLVDRPKLVAVLDRMLDPEQFLSDFGLRSLSKEHATNPFTCHGQQVRYEPAESASPIYGGNSNWRGPIWFPMNFLMVESLNAYYSYYGETQLVELPVGSGHLATLKEAADEIARRLTTIFLRDPTTGRRAVFGDNAFFQTDPHWRDEIPFHEYFHGDDGAGLGASHQTGWTALVAELIRQSRLGATALQEGPMSDHPPGTRQEAPVELKR